MSTLFSRRNSSEFTNRVLPGVSFDGSNRYSWIPERTKNLSNLHLNTASVFSYSLTLILVLGRGVDEKLETYLDNELDAHSLHINI
jgi:3-deoxy-D-arabino-heptulosonate 7-phosphate (DAHP) synthase class II